MAKGKHAALSANRRAEAAHEHIDRLSTELVEAKIRARDAEEVARMAELRLKRSEDELARTEKLRESARKVVDETRAHYKAGWEKWEKAKPDFNRLLIDAINAAPSTLGPADRVEFLFYRYPKLMDFLGHKLDRGVHSELHGSRRMDPDDVRRMGRWLGERATIEWDPDVDAARIAADLMDVPSLDLSKDEIYELFGVTSSEDAG